MTSNTATYRQLGFKVKVLQHEKNGRSLRIEFPKKLLKFAPESFVYTEISGDIVLREAILDDFNTHKINIPKNGLNFRLYINNMNDQIDCGEYKVYLDRDILILSKKDY